LIPSSEVERQQPWPKNQTARWIACDLGPFAIHTDRNSEVSKKVLDADCQHYKEKIE